MSRSRDWFEIEQWSKEPMPDSWVEARLQYLRDKIIDFRHELLARLISLNSNTSFRVEKLERLMNIEFNIDEFLERLKDPKYADDVWGYSPIIVNRFFDNHDKELDDIRVNKEETKKQKDILMNKWLKIDAEQRNKFIMEQAQRDRKRQEQDNQSRPKPNAKQAKRTQAKTIEQADNILNSLDGLDLE